jgi:hypothetical protein
MMMVPSGLVWRKCSISVFAAGRRVSTSIEECGGDKRDSVWWVYYGFT